MQTLRALLTAFGRRSGARWWLGERPDVRAGQVAGAIAGMLGYPTVGTDTVAAGNLTRLDRPQAAHVLALAGTRSLAHGSPTPSRGRVKDAALALGDLGADAVFLSNGLWQPGALHGWSPLTEATFDCGVIGYDAATAFIFWVEEED